MCQQVRERGGAHKGHSNNNLLVSYGKFQTQTQKNVIVYGTLIYAIRTETHRKYQIRRKGSVYV